MLISIDAVNVALNEFIAQTQANTHQLVMIVVVLYGVFVITRVFPFLLALGIWPRRLYGIPGIAFAPFLHANFNHLFFNTIPLVILSNFLLMNGLPFFLTVTVWITLISGFCIWCFAKPGIHIGASAVITGYWGLLVSDIYQQGTLMSILLGVVCVYYFAGIFFGIFPSEKGVSWEGHLFGLLAGVGLSFLLTWGGVV
jgi:membrane associated rhomboid family serine protease